MTQLNADPETEFHAPNHVSREVISGHFVLVDPAPLPSPKLVAMSADMAALLGLGNCTDNTTNSLFVRFFGGDVRALPGLVSW